MTVLHIAFLVLMKIIAMNASQDITLMKMIILLYALPAIKLAKNAHHLKIIIVPTVMMDFI